MTKRRDNMLLLSGLLIGFGAGLCVGMFFLIFAFTMLLHHMFIIGIQWTAPGFLLLFIGLPVIFVTAGILVSKKARGIEG